MKKVDCSLKIEGMQNKSKAEKESIYFRFLSQQLAEKNKRSLQEKEADINFKRMEIERQEREEQERRKFFTKLNNIQKINDKK